MEKMIEKIRKNKWIKINKGWKNMKKKLKRNEKLIGQVEKNIWMKNKHQKRRGEMNE